MLFQGWSQWQPRDQCTGLQCHGVWPPWPRPPSLLVYLTSFLHSSNCFTESIYLISCPIYQLTKCKIIFLTSASIYRGIATFVGTSYSSTCTLWCRSEDKPSISKTIKGHYVFLSRMPDLIRILRQSQHSFLSIASSVSFYQADCKNLIDIRERLFQSLHFYQVTAPCHLILKSPRTISFKCVFNPV